MTIFYDLKVQTESKDNWYTVGFAFNAVWEC